MSGSSKTYPSAAESTATGEDGNSVGHQIQETVERITVSARAAGVHLVAGDASDSTEHAQATLVFVPERDEAQGSFVERFSVEHEGEDLRIDEREGIWPGGTLRISLVQPSASVRIRSRSGAVAVSGLEGNLAVRSRNGAISANRCTGSLKLMCANGSIELAQCSAGRVELSSSNGRITVGNTELGGGTVKTANGRIRMQLRPHSVAEGAGDPEGAEDTGRLAIYSANGGISLAVPDEAATLFKIRSLGWVKNDLPVQSVQSSADMTVIKTGSSESQDAPFVVLIKNLKGRIDLRRYVHFDPHAEERRSDDEFFEEGQPHGLWFDVDFGEELPKFMHDVKRFGAKFGNVGEEISREMRDAFVFGRRQDRGPSQDTPQENWDTSVEVASVLKMLKEGKLTIGEAETLIAAIRR